MADKQFATWIGEKSTLPSSVGSGDKFPVVRSGVTYFASSTHLPVGGGALDAAVFNVKTDYAATGDGVTNDYTAITNAVAAAKASSAVAKIIYFPGDSVYRITTTGSPLHGMIIDFSNVTVMGGPNSTILLDNLVSGNAVGHGIHVKGPCSNVEIRGLKVKYVAMNTTRSGYAPIYALGANIGTGDVSGWYRGTSAGENSANIASGAVVNFRVIDCHLENSPSVFVGVVGVDGARLHRLRCHNSWADGLYHLYFRGSIVSDCYLTMVGDDALSMASYESNLTSADIELPFHGEGSVITNLVSIGQYPSFRYNASGSLVFLGVRDISANNIHLSDHFRGIRYEIGTSSGAGGNPDQVNLNLNFLACRRININNVTIKNVIQGLSVLMKEGGPATLASKWWQFEGMTLSNITMRGDTSPPEVTTAFDVGAIYGGSPVFAGFELRNVNVRNMTNTGLNFGPLKDCRIEVDLDQKITFSGFVPNDGTTLANAARFEGSSTFISSHDVTFLNVRAKEIIFSGFKGGRVEYVESHDAPANGITFYNSGNMTAGTVRAINWNRAATGTPDGVYLDPNSRRLRIESVYCEQDTNAIGNGLSIQNQNDNWVNLYSIRHRVYDNYYHYLADAKLAAVGIAQVGRHEYTPMNLAYAPNQYMHVKEYPITWISGTNGDSDKTLYPGNEPEVYRITSVLTRNMTVTLSGDGAVIGTELQVVRAPSATGAFTVAIVGPNGSGGTTTITTIPSGVTGSARFRWVGTVYEPVAYSKFSWT